jgi:GDPmannose 4,6-dehydratase
MDKPDMRLEVLDVLPGCDIRLDEILRGTKFDAVYNFLGQSSVGNSFTSAAETLLTNSWFVALLIDAISRLAAETRLYLASSSEIFGPGKEGLTFSEVAAFDARSPYAISKADVVWQARNARQQSGSFVAAGITCNHESPLRDSSFVIPKLISGLVERHTRPELPPIQLGCINVTRDWSFAGDIINGIFKCTNCDEADDFILASGTSSKLADIITVAAEIVGFSATWEVENGQSRLVDNRTGRIIITGSVHPVRQFDALYMAVDTTKASTVLDWRPQLTISSLIEFLVATAHDRAAGRPLRLVPDNFEFVV